MAKPLTLEDIDARLKQVVLILAQQALHTSLKEVTQREKINFLHKGGLKNDEIADLLITTARVVAVEISALRKIEKNKPTK